MTNFFTINRRLTQTEAKEWLQKYLGDALISLISLSKSGEWAKVVVNTDKGKQEVKISLPVVKI